MRHALLITALFFSGSSHAHLRWFVDADIPPASFGWSNTYNWLIAGGALYCLLALIIERTVKYSDKDIAAFRPWPGNLQLRLLSLAMGFSLLCSTLGNHFIAPNIQLGQYTGICNTIQLLAAAALLTTVWPKFSGWLLIALSAVATIAIPPHLWIDYVFEFVAIALAILFADKPAKAAWWLRVGLGMQLMVLATHNKFLSPELGLAFLQHYPWNFMPALGFDNFTDLQFVFSAGVAEFSFGLLIAAGVATRFSVASVSFFFVTTIILMGVGELIGHLPIVAGAITLISLGSGQRPSLPQAVRKFRRAQLAADNSL